MKLRLLKPSTSKTTTLILSAALALSACGGISQDQLNKQAEVCAFYGYTPQTDAHIGCIERALTKDNSSEASLIMQLALLLAIL